MELNVLLLDIEGTTTPISFVYDVLFPYAREHVADFLRERFDDPGVEKDRRDLAAEEGIDPDSLDDLVAAVRRQMDADQKTTPLKSLQGKIWKAGYEDGSLRGAVFDDVPGVMRDVVDAGVRVCIYSSGSVAAQRLLFAHSTAGNLSVQIGAYFDTTTGPKKDAASYEAIGRALGTAVERILFCTDSLAEAQAAHEAGVRAVLLARPGNPEIEPNDFETWSSLEPVRQYL